MKVLHVTIVAVACLIGQMAGFPICDNLTPSSEERSLIDSYIHRLLTVDSSQAMISIQLADQSRFTTLAAQLRSLEDRSRAATNSTQVGTLAHHAMAVLSACHDPQNFVGINLLKLVQERLDGQFENGDVQRAPQDGWYQYGLALQALCVGGNRIKKYNVRMALRQQEKDGSWNHRPDPTAQMLLALLCVKDVYRSDHIITSIKRAVAYLESAVVSGDDQTIIGDLYSTPDALLALAEARKVTFVDMSFCSSATKSTFLPLVGDEPEAVVTQRLAAMSGSSVLSFGDGWSCHPPVSTTTPVTTTAETSTSTTVDCEKITDKEDLETDINVVFLVIESPEAGISPPYDYIQNVTGVAAGSSLLEIMRQAQCTGNFKFETASTAFGPYVSSVNGVTAHSDQRQYWSVLNGATESPHPTGVDSYVPRDNEVVLFKLATW